MRPITLSDSRPLRYGIQGSLIGLAIIVVRGWLSDRMGAARLLMGVLLVISAFLRVFNLLAHQWHNRAVSSAGLVRWQNFDPAYSVAAIPLLMSMCRKGIVGSQFTTYMALVNLCDAESPYVSGHAQRVTLPKRVQIFIAFYPQTSSFYEPPRGCNSSCA